MHEQNVTVIYETSWVPFGSANVFRRSLKEKSCQLDWAHLMQFSLKLKPILFRTESLIRRETECKVFAGELSIKRINFGCKQIKLTDKII